MKQRNFKDMSGERFGRLTVKEFAGVKGSAQHASWKCVCDCGNEFVSVGASIRAGRTRSCGCLSVATRFEGKYARKHGKSNSRTYKIWLGMHWRCSEKSNKKAHLYALKGVSVCVRWSDFELFLADMGDAPEGMSIDRIDGSKGYSPDNCRWASPKQQANNTSANHMIEFGGKAQTLSMWASEIGVKPNTLLYRIRRGVPLDLAMRSGPVNTRTEAMRERARRCLACGSEFIPRMAQIRAGQGKFCSQACNGAFRTAAKLDELDLLADTIQELSK